MAVHKWFSKEEFENADRYISFSQDEVEFWLFFDEHEINLFHYISGTQKKRLSSLSKGKNLSQIKIICGEVFFCHPDDDGWRPVTTSGLAEKIISIHKERLFTKELEEALNE